MCKFVKVVIQLQNLLPRCTYYIFGLASFVFLLSFALNEKKTYNLNFKWSFSLLNNYLNVSWKENTNYFLRIKKSEKIVDEF